MPGNSSSLSNTPSSQSGYRWLSVGDSLVRAGDKAMSEDRKPRKRLTDPRQRAGRKGGLTAWARNRERMVENCRKNGRRAFGEGSAASLHGHNLAMRRWGKYREAKEQEARRKGGSEGQT